MKNTKQLVIAALLIAMGIIIPLVMPIKISTGIASYTLGSHVPVMIAMFVSPLVAVLVALGTAAGFFVTATYVIALRALSHIVFAVIGALMIRKNRNVLNTKKSEYSFSAFIGLIHILMECLVVAITFAYGSQGFKEFLLVVIVSVGFGGFIHSMVDFFISSKVIKSLKLNK